MEHETGARKAPGSKESPTCKTPDGIAGHCVQFSDCHYEEFKRRPAIIFQHRCYRETSSEGVCCPDPDARENEITDDLNDNVRRKRATTAATTTKTVDIIQAQECGINGKSITRVTKADKSDPKDWPWMAVLLRKEDYLNFCGAVILNRRYILTAAHCVQRKTVNDFYVRLGEYDFTRKNETVFVDFLPSNIVAHPDYDPATQQHDIALIEIQGDAAYNSFVRPICLPSSTTKEPSTNSTVVVTGWGSTFFGSQVSDILMEVPVPLWDWSNCVTKYAQTIFDTNICAAGYAGGEDSCQGDSGGPLVVQADNGRWTTIGVVSWGIGCGEFDQPGVYTKVDRYLNWIAPIIQNSAP